jgi:hypothetical protein
MSDLIIAKHRAALRMKGEYASPYRIGILCGKAGDNVSSPYVPGSRGDRLFSEGYGYGMGYALGYRLGFLAGQEVGRANTEGAGKS